jgi:hypothetical protein
MAPLPTEHPTSAMSINPIPDPHPFTDSVAARANAAARAKIAVGARRRGEAIPGSPPPEVFAAMLTAAQAADRLTAAGRALRFSTNEATGLSVQLTDLEGTVLGRVTPSAMLAIASGEPLH